MKRSPTVRRSCITCQGTGEISVSYCGQCQTTIADDDEWWANDDALMPCGHSHEAHLIIEEAPCLDCQGKGYQKHLLTPEEQRLRQHKRIVRVIFLILLVLMLLTALIIVIGDDPGYMCGFWWYGTGAFFVGYRFWA